MKNPFITLTKERNGNPIRINVTCIQSYDTRSYSNDTSKTYTYILLKGGPGLTREVTETVEEIDELINNYYAPEK
tara:strand:- start:3237 stop:3461 length:225 start_codon:yes stop_codon:yes gene_type:complete